MRNAKKAGVLGYRKGVVLGLTIAEIILLILFALLLALTGVLIKRQAAVRAEVLASVANQKQQVATMNPAVYQTGVEFKKLFENKTPQEVLILLKDAQAQIEKLKAELAKYASSEIPPPCYQKVYEGRTPYVYDMRIRNEGIVIVNTVPDRLRPRFNNDFPVQPPLDKVLSAAEFKLATNSFISYGRANACKFYVKVYDDSLNNKEKFKSLLKTVESNFVWTFIMTLKPGSQGGEDLDLFQTTPVR